MQNLCILFYMTLTEYQKKMNLLAALRNSATSLRESILVEKDYDVREMLKVNLASVEREMSEANENEEK
jgi:hypothetical protein